MRRAALLLALTVTLAAQGLQRRPLGAPARSGWGTVTLDAAATRQQGSLWISDAEGRPVPFLEVQAGGRTLPAVVPDGLRLGKDPAGRPTAAFLVPADPGERVLRLEVEAQDRPWIARPLLERQGPGGTWVTWDPKPRPHVWDLGAGSVETEVTLPAEPGPWRLILKPVVGRLPRLTGLSFASRTTTWTLATEARFPLAFEPAGPGTWALALPQGEDLRRLEVQLRPPAAPLRAELLIPRPPVEGRPQPPIPLPAHGALWALPALDSEGTTLTLEAPHHGPLLLRLPEGAEPIAIQALCGRATLAFPAEAGRRYFLHSGGARRQAPGDLATLQAGVDPQAAESLSLGPAEADPHGQAETIPTPSLWDRTASLWPWLMGGLVALLALFGLRLLRPRP